MKKRLTGGMTSNVKQQPLIGVSVQGAWSTWATREAAAWTCQMRYLWRDCVIRMHMYGEDGVTTFKDIVGHRLILARWPYFARLFALDAPNRMEAYEGENGRTEHCHAYDIVVPFDVAIVRVLIDMLYDPRCLTTAVLNGECDAIDLIDCALFFNAERHLLLHIIEVTLDALLPPEIDAEAATAPNDAIGAVLLRILNSGVDDEIKSGLVARFAYLLSDGDRATLADTFGLYYDPARCFLLEPATPGALRLFCSLRDPQREVTFATPHSGDVTVKVECGLAPDTPMEGLFTVKVFSSRSRWKITYRKFKVVAATPLASITDNPQPTSSSWRTLSSFAAWRFDIQPQK